MVKFGEVMLIEGKSIERFGEVTVGEQSYHGQSGAICPSCVFTTKKLLYPPPNEEVLPTIT